MLITEKFNANDYNSIKGIPKSFRILLFLYAAFLVPASFLFGLLGLSKKGNGYWPTTVMILAVFSIIILWVIAKEYLAYKKDLSKQEKLSGTLIVKRKSSKKGETIIYLDSKELKKLNVYFKVIFDKIDIDDKLKIEISKYSKCLFLLEKNGEQLFPPLTK